MLNGNLKNEKKFFQERKKMEANCMSGSEKGFGLIETLVSVFLFSLISVLIAGVFASFLRSNIGAKRMQRSVENVQFAMNLMSKTIRTSEVRLVGNDTLELFDFTQSKCLRYSWSGGASKKLQVNYSGETSATSLASCTFAPMAGVQDLTSADIEHASFDVVPTDPINLGTVTMAFTLKEDAASASTLNIQTAVSMRNHSAP